MLASIEQRPRQTVRVLLADDHDAILRGVKGLIECGGRFQVVGEARGGGDALQLSRELKPDIAILDYSLPEMNGRDLAVSIRRDSPRTEILLYSLHDDEETISGVLRAGARGYVVKGDPESHLLAALEALSSGRPYFSPTASDAILDVLAESKSGPTGGGLSQREREIVQLISEGNTNKQIAHRLGVTVKTVESHRSKAVRKLQLRTTADLVRWALRTNLVQP